MFSLKRLLPASALVFSLVACSDGTSPSPVDPLAVSEAVAFATSTFNNNAAFQSLTIVIDHLPSIGGASAILANTLPRPSSRHVFGMVPRTLVMPKLHASSSSHPDALFPVDLLGKTLVWDTTSLSYVVSANATGAPANGVRLLLYFADPNTNLPFKPLQVLGYLDLTDKSTPQADKLGVLVAIVNQTVASYDVTLTVGLTSATERAVGYFLDGTAANRVDFDIQDTGTETAITRTSSLSTEDGDHINVTLKLSLVTTSSLTVSVAHANSNLEMSASGNFFADTPQPMSGAVKFNGNTVGTIGGSTDDPTITGASGHTFTQGEVDALFNIFVTAGDIALTVATGVFAPANMVFSASVGAGL